MLTLNSTDVINALSTASSVNGAWEGDNVVSGSDNFGGLPVFQFPTGTAGSIWAALAGQSVVYLRAFNTTANNVTITVFKNGTTSGFQMTQFTIPPLGTAIYDGASIAKFDQFGNPSANG